jgi:hypothetical protein
MKYKYMVLHVEPGEGFDRVLSHLADSGWRVRTHVLMITSGPAPARPLVVTGEKLLLEKPDNEGLTDAELEALSTVVRVELTNHEVQARMAAKHGDFMMFQSSNLERLQNELRKREIIE